MFTNITRMCSVIGIHHHHSHNSLYGKFRIVNDKNKSCTRELTNMVHTKCRSTFYLSTDIRRLDVKDDQLSWNMDLPEYSPMDYDSPILDGKVWADPHINCSSFKPKFNELDGKINRKSHTGIYKIVNDRPLNPEGRTGLQGRGILGKWGPNHAADPVVTRWKLLDGTKVADPVTKRPVLQFCGIQRHDCGQWAIPGGMVDPGEKVSETLKREFSEEAFNSLKADKEECKQTEMMIGEFFAHGDEVYRGYVDDPRNTDNAWMETIVVNFHDEENSTVGQFKLQAGDDAKNVKWIDIHKNLDLYASHSDFIKAVADLRDAHW